MFFPVINEATNITRHVVNPNAPNILLLENPPL